MPLKGQHYMSKIFRTNILSLSGKDISVNIADTNTFLRHDGNFAAVNTGNFISSSQTGQFYPLSNPSNFTNSGNIYSTGNILDAKINSLSGNLIQTGVNILNYVSNNYATTGDTQYLLDYINGPVIEAIYFAYSGTELTGQYLYELITGVSGNAIFTGQILNNKINSLSGWIANNPSGYITSAQTGSFGGGGSQADALNLSGNLFQTGDILNNKINNLSGYLTGAYLTGIVAGTNITVNNNLNGTYTINSTAAGGGGGVTGIGINNSTGITGYVNFVPFNNISMTQSGNNVYFDSNVTGVGDLYFPTNAGVVSAFEFPIGTGITSGTVESYSFNINYTPVATIYSEYNNQTGVQNSSFIINEGFGLISSGLSAAATLGTKPFYIYNGTSPAIINLPAIDFCTGRMYFIKNRGATLTVTGNRLADTFFTTQVTKSLTINSGEAYILCNDGLYWEVM